MHNGVLRHWRTLIAAVGCPDQKSSLEQPLKNIGARVRVERPKPNAFNDRQLQAGGLVELLLNPLSQ